MVVCPATKLTGVSWARKRTAQVGKALLCVGIARLGGDITTTENPSQKQKRSNAMRKGAFGCTSEII